MNPSAEALAGSRLRGLTALRRALAEEAVPGRWLGAIWASLALHVLLGARLESLPPPRLAVRPPSEVRFEVVTKPLPSAPIAPEPEPSPPPRAPPSLKARPKVTPEPSPPEPAMQTPPPATDTPPPPELSGLTLTEGKGPGAFAMPSGNGQERGGALGAIGNAPAPPREAPPAPRGPLIVPLGELGARPVPPSLAQALSRNYPPEARRRGVAGRASVRARIDADGVPRALVVVEESFAGFGPACRDTLAASRWSPPKARDGRAVASEVLYTCRFVITP